ncbi:MAG: hypothetical protein V3V45_01125 [Candidatus Brocadiales bacterium]
MRLFLKLLFICIMFIPVALLQQRDAQAIPVFARKYKTSCSTCHWVAFPKLNAFGMAFRARNYRIPPEDEIYVKDEAVEMGSEGYKKVFPDAVWPSTIPYLPPISFVARSEFHVGTRTAPDDSKYNFVGVEGIELLTAGTLGESFSWFGAVAINEASSYEYESGTEIERFFWQYTPRWIHDDQPGLFSVRFGVFEVRAAPFRDHLRLIRTTMDLADMFAITPTGNYSRMHKQAGVEIFGAHNGFGGKGGVRWSAGVVNGQPGGYMMWSTSAYGNTMMIGNHVSEQWEGKFDTNNAKDYYARVNYKIGGMGVLGGTQEGLGSAKNWIDNSLTLGGFFYRGTNGYFKNPVMGTGWSNSGNKFWRYGGEARLDWWNFRTVAAVTRFEDNPETAITIGGKSGKDFNATIYSGRVNFVTPGLPWIIPSLRVEHADPDYDAGDWPSFTRTSFDLSLLIRANVKAIIGGNVTSSDWNGPRPAVITDSYHMSMAIGL